MNATNSVKSLVCTVEDLITSHERFFHEACCFSFLAGRRCAHVDLKDEHGHCEIVSVCVSDPSSSLSADEMLFMASFN